eukprot:TRINITY_DN1982_c0_g1_i2.p1 TRINITY_DN1982_c0_g1~~TRINITY_DN1982_c0_g1_i2.p1  ORF type:complete len:688 (+),score=150.35 TRINITY_DN1982_c0_g1_i2:214-2064(+)
MEVAEGIVVTVDGDANIGGSENVNQNELLVPFTDKEKARLVSYTQLLGDDATRKSLLEGMSKVDAQLFDMKGNSLLIAAVCEHHLDIVEELCQSHREHIDELNSVVGTTALHVANEMEYKEAIDVLLKYGAKDTTEDDFGFTPSKWDASFKATRDLDPKDEEEPDFFVLGSEQDRTGLPIMFFPGIMSSALRIDESIHPEWIGKRLWVNVRMLVSHKINPLHAGAWIKHMNVVDGHKDPEGIRVRPIEGLPGITALSNGPFSKSSSYVFHQLVNELKKLKYGNYNMKAAGYDWRIPPSLYGQTNENYFTKWKGKIENLKKVTEKKVVILAHSMGNKVFSYFLRWILREDKMNGQQWIDDHIEVMVSVGAPWLGAPKILKSMTVGDGFDGLDWFVSKKEFCSLTRSLGSTPLLWPLRTDLLPSDHITNIQDKDSAGVFYRSMSTMKLSDSITSTSNHWNQFYKDDPLYYKGENVGNTKLELETDLPGLQCPPVKRLVCIHGKGLDTEVGHYYTTSNGNYSLDHQLTKHQKGLEIRGGIAYETKDTPQIRFENGAQGSGDGTVPFASLNFPKKWREERKFSRPLGTEIEIHEIEGGEHRKILNDKDFLRILKDILHPN